MDAIQALTNVSQPINKKPLKARHALFVQSYLLTKNASESARRAGYSVHTAGVIGCALLKKPRIKAEIERLQQRELESVEAKVEEQRIALTKDGFIQKALKDYEVLPVEHPNRMRALDLAGRAEGIIGKDGPTTNNNTMIINLQDTASLPTGAKWDRLRSLLDAQ